MKITRRQLKKIIKESLLLEAVPLILAGIGAYAVAGWLFGKTYKMKVASRNENIDFTNLALELQYNFGKYEKMFNDLYSHAMKCGDTYLAKELGNYISAGKLLAELIGEDFFDTSDIIGTALDVSTSGLSSSAAAPGAISLAKDATRTASSSAKRLLGPTLAVIFSGYDVYEAESVAAEVAKKVDVNKLHDDLEGFLNLQAKIKSGTLPC